MLKKPGFLAILFLIPFLTAGVNQMAKTDSGIMRIALFQESQEDDYASDVIRNLMEHSEVVQYLPVEDKEEGIELVRDGKADALWIFPENMRERLEDYAQGISQDDGVITVIEKEEQVAVQLTRELLYGELYDTISYALYQSYITERMLADETVPEKQLRDAYKQIDAGDNIFIYSSFDGEAAPAQQSYLLMPVRGIMSVLLVLVGLTFSLYYMQDEKKGCFTWFYAQRTPAFAWLYQLPGLLDVAVVSLAGMVIIESFTDWKRELIFMGLYLFMIMGFCDLLRRLCKRISILGSMIPILMVLMLALCPIFIKVNSMKAIQLLLPPYHYLNAFYNQKYVCYMVVYIAATFVIDRMLHWIENRK